MRSTQICDLHQQKINTASATPTWQNVSSADNRFTRAKPKIDFTGLHFGDKVSAQEQAGAETGFPSREEGGDKQRGA